MLRALALGIPNREVLYVTRRSTFRSVGSPSFRSPDRSGETCPFHPRAIPAPGRVRIVRPKAASHVSGRCGTWQVASFADRCFFAAYLRERGIAEPPTLTDRPNRPISGLRFTLTDTENRSSQGLSQQISN